MKFYISVTQKLLWKKTHYEIEISDGVAEVTYANEKVANASFENLKKQKPSTKIIGTTIYDYYPKKKAEIIKDLYIEDIKKAQKTGSKILKVDYIIKTEKEVKNGKNIR